MVEPLPDLNPPELPPGDSGKAQGFINMLSEIYYHIRKGPQNSIDGDEDNTVFIEGSIQIGKDGEQKMGRDYDDIQGVSIYDLGAIETYGIENVIDLLREGLDANNGSIEAVSKNDMKNLELMLVMGSIGVRFEDEPFSLIEFEDSDYMMFMNWDGTLICADVEGVPKYNETIFLNGFFDYIDYLSGQREEDDPFRKGVFDEILTAIDGVSTPIFQSYKRYYSRHTEVFFENPDFGPGFIIKQYRLDTEENREFVRGVHSAVKMLERFIPKK